MGGDHLYLVELSPCLKGSPVEGIDSPRLDFQNQSRSHVLVTAWLCHPRCLAPALLCEFMRKSPGKQSARKETARPQEACVLPNAGRAWDKATAREREAGTRPCPGQRVMQ